MRVPETYWACSADHVVALLDSDRQGLSSLQVVDRLKGAPQSIGDQRISNAALVFRQFQSPIVMMLVGAAMLSFLLQDTVDASIVIGVITLSAILGFVQEHGAVRAIDALRESVKARTRVLRDRREIDLSLAEIVLGDVVVLSAGDVVPGDGVLLESHQLQVDESVLTGESFPQIKEVGISDATATVSERKNCLHLGSHVVSGEARMIIVHTGVATEFGRLAEHVGKVHIPTSFERGATSFGLLLLKSTVALVVAVLVINISLSRPMIDSLLFSLALAIGLTPQMLPAIITLSLSKGASFMARKSVIIKRLDAIEDIGSIDILFTDKTGTITAGTVEVHDAVSVDGFRSKRVSDLAVWNASLQTGYRNSIDDAIVRAFPPTSESRDVVLRKGEIPYDFDRKRLSVWVHLPSESLLVSKGAVAEVLAVCTQAQLPDGSIAPIADVREMIGETFKTLSLNGFRVLGISVKDFGDQLHDDVELSTEDESEMTFVGFVVLIDPPKDDAADAIEKLRSLGVDVRIISGDNRHTTSYVAEAVGISTGQQLTGKDIEAMDDSQLQKIIETTTVFAETSPLMKERIVHAATRAGHTVGYLGDGINDAPALRIADVGISVDSAVGVAKQVADVVILQKDLAVLLGGICEGRRVFANTLKYVHVTTSASFGNVLSLAIATILLPFLPMLPTQILVLNFLSDLPALTISADRVDEDQLSRPVSWDIRKIQDFMVVFGLASTVFDVLTFLIARQFLHANAELTRSIWFVESALTEMAVMLVLRTRRFFLFSRPGTSLLIFSAITAVAAFGLPYSLLATDFGFVAIPISGVLVIAGLVMAYVIVTESLKMRFKTLMKPTEPGVD